jgi:hypothetical protein
MKKLEEMAEKYAKQCVDGTKPPGRASLKSPSKQATPPEMRRSKAPGRGTAYSKEAGSTPLREPSEGDVAIGKNEPSPRSTRRRERGDENLSRDMP